MEVAWHLGLSDRERQAYRKVWRSSDLGRLSMKKSNQCQYPYFVNWFQTHNRESNFRRPDFATPFFYVFDLSDNKNVY